MHDIPSVVLWRGTFYFSVGDAHLGGGGLVQVSLELLGPSVEAAALFLKGETAPSLPSLWPPSHWAGSRSSLAP